MADQGLGKEGWPAGHDRDGAPTPGETEPTTSPDHLGGLWSILSKAVLGFPWLPPPHLGDPVTDGGGPCPGNVPTACPLPTKEPLARDRLQGQVPTRPSQPRQTQLSCTPTCSVLGPVHTQGTVPSGQAGALWSEALPPSASPALEWGDSEEPQTPWGQHCPWHHIPPIPGFIRGNVFLQWEAGKGHTCAWGTLLSPCAGRAWGGSRPVGCLWGREGQQTSHQSLKVSAGVYPNSPEEMWAPVWEVAELRCGPGPRSVTAALVLAPPLSTWRSRGPESLKPDPGCLWGLWFGAGVHPGASCTICILGGQGASLSAPTDRNFCAVGSDGLISGRWPTAAVAAPYQTPSRPHLSTTREAREAQWVLISQGPPGPVTGRQAFPGPGWVSVPKGSVWPMTSQGDSGMQPGPFPASPGPPSLLRPSEPHCLTHVSISLPLSLCLSLSPCLSLSLSLSL